MATMCFHFEGCKGRLHYINGISFASALKLNDATTRSDIGLPRHTFGQRDQAVGLRSAAGSFTSPGGICSTLSKVKCRS